MYAKDRKTRGKRIKRIDFLEVFFMAMKPDRLPKKILKIKNVTTL